MPKEESFFIRKSSFNFISTILHKTGSQKLIIMSHGFTGYKSETGRLFVEAARTFTKSKIDVLRFDFIGSGDSSGDFSNMCPNSEIKDLHFVIQWAKKKGYKKIGLLGMSMGGAVTICTAAQLKPNTIQAMVTWSAVPSFKWWQSKLNRKALRKQPYEPGKKFYTNHPKKEVPESYLSIKVPKLQIQGDKDHPGFASNFAKFYQKASGPKKHSIVKGADHCFNNRAHRKVLYRESLNWFKKYL
jgi:uncharacterized protein